MLGARGGPMYRAALVFAFVAACGGKKDRDCDGYAAKVVDLSDATPGSLAMVEQVSKDACTSGRTSDAELACAEKATTRKALIECTVGPSVTPPAPPTPKPSGRVVFKGAVNGPGFKPLDSEYNSDQRAWMASLEKDIAGCSSAEKYEPKNYVIVVTFGGGRPAVTPPADMPPELGECVVPLLAKTPPASVKKGPAEFYIAVGNQE